MAIWPLYRGSLSLVGPVGARPREGGHCAHHLGRRVATAQEVVSETRGGPFAPPAQQCGQPAAAGLEAPLRLGRLGEGGGDGGRGQVARNTLLEELLAKAATTDAAAAGSGLGPEAREGNIVHVTARGQLRHYRTRDFIRGAPTLQSRDQLAGAPGFACQKLEGRQLGGLRIQLPPFPGAARRAAAPRRHGLRPAWRRPEAWPWPMACPRRSACPRSARPRNRRYSSPRSSHPWRKYP